MTDLIWEDSQSGSKVPRWKGRLLASRLDPEGEAQAWILRRREFLDKVKSVFVLGLGGAFHIREILHRSEARIVVIERESAIVESVMPQVLEEFGPRVSVMQIERVAELRSDYAVREALEASFLVLEHPASVAMNRDFYSQCSALLIGREWGALTWQWRLRGLADLDSEPKVTRTENPLTIYDLAQTELVRESTEREKLLLRALRELVK